MSTKVNLPDGRALYVQTDDPTAAAKAVKAFLDKESAQKRIESERGIIQDIDDRVRATTRGIPYIGRGSDEISTALNTLDIPVNPGGAMALARGGKGNPWQERVSTPEKMQKFLDDQNAAYETELAYQRARDADFDARHPKESTGLQIGGAVLGTLAGARALGGAGVRMPGSLTGRMAVGIPIGASISAADEFLGGEGGFHERMEGVPLAAGIGAGLGFAGPVLGSAIGAGVNKFIRPNVPSAETLRALARTALAKADEAGLRLSQQGYGRAVDSVRRATDSINATVHPKTYATLQEILGVRDSAPTLTKVGQLRRIAKDAAMSSDEADATLASKVFVELDDFVNRLGRRDMVAANSKEAAEQLRKTDEVLRQSSKADAIQELFKRASKNNSPRISYEDALREEFESLVNNPKRFNIFTPNEQRAILRVGRAKNAELALKLIADLPKSWTGSLGAGGGLVVGGQQGAMVGGAIGTALPYLARKALGVMTRRSANAVDDLVRSGGEIDTPAAAAFRRIAQALVIGQSGEAGKWLAPFVPSLSGPGPKRR